MGQADGAARKRPPFEEAVLRLKDHPLLGPVASDIHFYPVSRQQNDSQSKAYCWLEPGVSICMNSRVRLDVDGWLAVLGIATLAYAVGGPKLLPWPDAVSDQAVTLAALHWWASIRIGTLPEDLEMPDGLGHLGRRPLAEIAAHLRATPEDQVLAARCALTRGSNERWMRPPPRAKTWREWNLSPQEKFAQALVDCAQRTLQVQHDGNLSAKASPRQSNSTAAKARRWLISHYPLLAPLLMQFELVEDAAVCRRLQIQVAAIHMGAGEIYVNPAFRLGLEGAKFVIAHEILHAGLCHASRRRGRDPYLWNVACDFVINDWLVAMGVGSPPDLGLLFDEEMRGWAAEDIYQRLVTELRIHRRLRTLRGQDCDMLDSTVEQGFTDREAFYRRALLHGLNYHVERGRGELPGDLVEQIRTLNQPAIAWEVQLAEWIQERFTVPERLRNYARPSRRQSATPEIPRPRPVQPKEQRATHTFAVVIDTSGSMTREDLGKALGAIVSYGQAQEVRQVRLVYCDAAPVDVGFVAIETLAERVSVRGRGGTVLQGALDLLERQSDLPKGAPVLVITDGMCEDHLEVRRDHAFLLVPGGRLPFRTTRPVFEMR